MDRARRISLCVISRWRERKRERERERDSAKQVKYEIMDTAAHASRCTGIKLIESAILEFMKEQEINLFGWLCTTNGSPMWRVQNVACHAAHSRSEIDNDEYIYIRLCGLLKYSRIECESIVWWNTWSTSIMLLFLINFFFIISIYSARQINRIKYRIGIFILER